MPTGACKNKPTNPMLKRVDYFVGSLFSSVPDSCQVILVDSLPRVGFLKTCQYQNVQKSPKTLKTKLSNVLLLFL